MSFDHNLINLLVNPAPWAWAKDRATLDACANNGGIAAQMQADPKKLGKEKKPDENLVSLNFPV